MRDVAKAAGVSVMTVSYALRGHPSISEETTQRVCRIARDLGYASHPLVSAFISEIRHGKEMKSPPTIGYVSMYKRREIWRHAPFHGAQFEGVSARCQALGFRLGVVEPMVSGLSGKRLTDVLLYNNYCGLIIAAMPSDCAEVKIDWTRFPLVVLGNTMPKPVLHRVEINHLQSMQLGFQHLSDLGYRKIALATFHQSSSRIGDHYLAAAELFNRKLPASRRIPPLICTPSGMTPKKLRQWIDRHRPDALIDAGQGRYRPLLTQAGLRIPDDLAYAVSNWTAACTGLAGLNQHPYEVGSAAVEVLAKQIYGNQKGIPAHRMVTLLDATWVDGASAPPVQPLKRKRKATKLP